MTKLFKKIDRTFIKLFISFKIKRHQQFEKVENFKFLLIVRNSLKYFETMKYERTRTSTI